MILNIELVKRFQFLVNMTLYC